MMTEPDTRVVTELEACGFATLQGGSPAGRGRRGGGGRWSGGRLDR